MSTVHGKELDQSTLNAYLRGAFANANQIVKFARVPTVSAYCADSACQSLVEKLNRILDGVVMMRQTDSENSDADIEVLFYPSTGARLLSKNQYTSKPDEVLGKLIHANCSIMQSRRGFEVVKVIIVVTEDAGSKENLVCVMSELLRGTGITVDGRYPEYLKPYLELDETRLAAALRGIALFLAMHVSPATQPGQDRTTVENQLKSNFIMHN